MLGSLCCKPWGPNVVQHKEMLVFLHKVGGGQEGINPMLHDRLSLQPVPHGLSELQ